MSRGHIRDRSGPRGAAYEVRAPGGTSPDGRRRVVTRTVRAEPGESAAATRRRAEQILTRLLAEIDEGGHAGPTGTFAALLDEWSRLKARSWSPKTELETARIIRLHLAPDRTIDEPTWRAAPGRLLLRQVTTARLDQHYSALLTGGLAPPTVRRIHGVARAALEQAVRWGWLTRNPAAYTEPIEGRSAEIHPPSTGDVARLIAHVGVHDAELALFIRLAAVLGRRRGELCALRWTDVDLADGTVTVARTLADSIADGWVERPISKNPRRQPPLAIDAGTVALLRSHRATVAEGLLLAGVALPADAHVFVRTDRRCAELLPRSPDAMTRRFQRARDEVGLTGVRLHDCRHYVATTLLDRGVSVTTAAGRLGHGDGGRTLQAVYAHWVPSTDREAADLLGGLLDTAGQAT